MKSKKTKKILFILILIGSFIFSMAVFLAFMVATSYQNKFYPRSRISNINLGGKTKEEAINILKNENEQYLNSGEIILTYKNNEKRLTPVELGIKLDPQRTVNDVFSKTHQNIFDSTRRVLWSLIVGNNWFQEVIIDSQTMDLIISDLAKEDIIEPKDAKLEIIDNNIIFSESSFGQEPNYPSVRSSIKEKVSNLNGGKINIEMVRAAPTINNINLAQAYFKVSLLLQNKGFKLKKSNLTYYNITASDLKNWLKFEKKSYFSNKDEGAFEGQVAGISISAKDKSGVFVLPQIKRSEHTLEASIDENKINEFIDRLAKNINQSAKDAKLGISNGKVIVLKRETYGAELDKTKLLEEINLRLNSSSENDIELPIKTLVPDVRSDNLNSLGIKEIIAVGESSFSGSPHNRIHNLTLGASKFNGAVIKPNETASFSKIIGNVEASDGYLPELVIKGTKTIQEYGGGMCQVSTTLYRAALQAGYPIVERRPHAYLVGYYKDGPDATVYVPSTDLKFKNDTNYYLLIQTRVEGKKLIFEFWSTKSGREIYITAPQYIDIIPAPSEPYYVDDPSYPIGYEKMEERPHEGATGLIYRTITYPDGKVKKEEIKSVYKPWPAKIRRGTGPADLPIPEANS